MLRPIVALGILAFALSKTAQAVPSSDLVFCSKFPDKDERIACYDAAARIAEARSAVRKERRPAIAAPVVSNEAQAAYASDLATAPSPTVKGAFHGFYAALGSSYGVQQPQNFGENGRINPDGASGVGVIGYNVQHGAFVGGLELSGRYGREGATGSDRVLADTDEFGNSAFYTYGLKHYTDASVHLSARFGVTVDSTLVFAQAGFGAAHNVREGTLFYSGGTCNYYFYGNEDRCLGYASTQFESRTIDEWLPSALFGIGIEHNFGPAFFRISGQAEAIKPANEFFWTARALALIGMRF